MMIMIQVQKKKKNEVADNTIEREVVYTIL